MGRNFVGNWPTLGEEGKATLVEVCQHAIQVAVHLQVRSLTDSQKSSVGPCRGYVGFCKENTLQGFRGLRDFEGLGSGANPPLTSAVLLGLGFWHIHGPVWAAEVRCVQARLEPRWGVRQGHVPLHMAQAMGTTRLHKLRQGLTRQAWRYPKHPGTVFAAACRALAVLWMQCFPALSLCLALGPTADWEPESHAGGSLITCGCRPEPSLISWQHQITERMFSGNVPRSGGPYGPTTRRSDLSESENSYMTLSLQLPPQGACDLHLDTVPMNKIKPEWPGKG